MFEQRGPSGRKQETRRCLKSGSWTEEARRRADRGRKQPPKHSNLLEVLLLSLMQLHHEWDPVF